jgi:hypothetical protein
MEKWDGQVLEREGKRKREREEGRWGEREWSESKYFNEVSARVVQERMCSKA